MTDPYAAARDRVLAAWTASPARFREDANAEEDAAAGSSLVAELAQNAADAARRAGVPGRLLVEVTDGVLYAANTGAPLDAAGVEALSHLRASAKSSGDVGRYGVGFKAVLAVTDEPAIVGRDGGVRWSRAETAAAVVAIPALADEAARRQGAVPVMRLPFAAVPDARAAELSKVFDTVVVLPLHTEPDLGDVDETLLLTLDLDEVTVNGRTFVRDPAWRVHTATGTLPAALLDGRPVEERERDGWSVTVAVPTREGVPVPWDGDRRLRAPQPTAERVDVPVFLSVSVPLEPSRRHVVPGPLTDWLAGRAAEAYVALLESLPSSPALLDLLPSTLPAGPVDLALREALAPLLPGVRAFPGHRRGEETAVVDAGAASDALTAALGLPQLVDPAWLGGGRRRAALTAFGARVLDTADVVDLLHGTERSPEEWATVYAAFAGVPDADALRALPVPLADGRVVTGPRGLLLPNDLVGVTEVAGLRWVHPAAATGRAAEVLRGAGAEPAEVSRILDTLRDAVEQSLDDEPPVEPGPLADVVLRLLAAEPGAAVDRPWLGSLALPSTDDELRAAEELLLPEAYGGRLVRWVRDDSPFGVVADGVAGTYGAAALDAAGVLRTFAVVRDDEPMPGAAYDLDDEAAYDFGGGPVAAVRDLEWVRDDAWPEALAELPVLDGYTLWWLRRNARLPAADGTFRPVRDLADPGSPLAPLYDLPAPMPLLDRLGLVTTVDALDDEGLADLADRVADRTAPLGLARTVYAALARTGVPLDPPRVRAVVDGALVTVATEDAYAVDRPDLLPLLAGRPWLPVDVTLGPALADVLGVRLASSLDVRVTSTPHATARLADLAPGAPDVGVDLHDPLLVNGIRVAWSLAGTTPALDGTPAGTARLVAWLRNRWETRHAVEAALRGDARDDETLLDP
ncbi:MAG: hypothetical protein QOE45_199 [Frankiaceae bacterium]|nr:hypothetical protein [Frankiaceae bacterium]